MVICPKCGKILEDGIRFCDNCGAQIPETVVCPNCGERTAAGFAFCQKCGAPISQAPNPGAGYAPAPGVGYAPAPNAGYAPDPGAGYAPDPNAGYAPNPGAGYAPDPNAGYAPNPNAGYAPNPGTGYAPDPNAGYTDPAAAGKQKKIVIPKKALIFGGIGVAAVAVVVAVVALLVNLLGGGGKTAVKTHLFYLKDREIIYFDLKSEDTLEVTSRLLSSGYSDYNLANNAYVLGSFIAFNEDNSRIFYPDRTDFNNARGVTLYYRSMKKTDQEPVKIDSDVIAYAINKAGTVVIYNKGSGGDLYKHDLENKDKIASNVTAFDVADDCNKVLYMTEDGNIYLWTAEGDKTKLASDISEVKYVSDDLSVIYYTKLDSPDVYPYTYSLYKQAVEGDEKVKIASEISNIVKIYESGEAYYVRSEDVERNLMDYVNDDMEAADAAMTEQPTRAPYPDAPTKPYFNDNWSTTGDYPKDEYPYWYYDENWVMVYYTQAEHDALEAQYDADKAAYDAECQRINDEYDQARQAYRDKQNRDNLRNSLKDATMTRTEYTLFYYNGTGETVVTDALTSAWDISYASDAATLLVRVYDRAEITKAKISEIEYSYEVREMIETALYSVSERCVAVQAVLTVVDQPDASYFRISADGSVIYFLDDMNENRNAGDLYKITIENGQVGRPELYDSDVNTNYMYFSADNQFVYYKDVDESNWKGDLYIDKVEIDYDVRLSYISYLGDAVLYYTDWNSSRDYGTLKKYENGEKVKIADDVHSFVIMDNDILYLYDYSTSSYNGTLYRYNKGEPVKIDDDVMALIPASSGRLKGNYYYGW